jgi:hypothetical protein
MNNLYDKNAAGELEFMKLNLSVKATISSQHTYSTARREDGQEGGCFGLGPHV